MTEPREAALTSEDHRQAFLEVSFLMNIFAATVHDLMGGATAPVGRVAGRQAAAKLPVYFEDPTLEGLLAELRDRLRDGFELAPQVEGRTARLTFGRCAIREACHAQGQAAGGELCTLFHYYVDGLVSGLLHRPAKSSIASAGERCTVQMETR